MMSTVTGWRKQDAGRAMGVNPQAQSIVYGAVLIVAVAATMSRARNAIVK